MLPEYRTKDEGKKRTWGIRTSYQEWREGSDERFKQTMMNSNRSKLLSRFHPRAWAACPIVGWPFSPRESESERIDVRVKSHRGSRIVHPNLLARFAARSDTAAVVMLTGSIQGLPDPFQPFSTGVLVSGNYPHASRPQAILVEVFRRPG